MDIGTIDFTELTDSSLEVETNLSSIVSEIVDDSLTTGDNLTNTINLIKIFFNLHYINTLTYLSIL